MVEQFPDIPREGLSPCVLSRDCLRVFDELENPDLALLDGADAALLAQARYHLPTCITCSTLFDRERRLRAGQRQQLRAVLDEGAQQVPSTLAAIMRAVREEPVSRIDATVAPLEPVMQQAEELHNWQVRRPIASRGRRVLAQLVALAAAVVLLATTIGVFQLLHIHTSVETTSNASLSNVVPSFALTNSWSAVILSYVQSDHLYIVNYDPLSGKRVALAESSYPAGTTMYGVAHTGNAVLYSVYDGTETVYWLRSATTLVAFYRVAGRGLQAVWSTDDHYIFIGTAQGVVMFDVLHGTSQRILAQLLSPQLVFAYANYLYYQDGLGGTTGNLKRIDINGGSIQTVTPCASAQPFWFSPTGKTVYYQCQGRNTYYAANMDGTQAVLLRANVGQVIGYTADNALLTLQHVNGTNQVVQLGATQAQDHVLLSSLAPGVSTLTVAQVGVAPYGSALVATTVAADGTAKLWYADLATGQQPQPVVIQGVTMLQQNGWDRLQVPGN